MQYINKKHALNVEKLPSKDTVYFSLLQKWNEKNLYLLILLCTHRSLMEVTTYECLVC